MTEYSNFEIFAAMILIGIVTYLLRIVFLLRLPEFTENETVKAGLDAVPSSMLVALVLPFALIVETSTGTEISLFRNEIYAILLTIPIVIKLKKPGYSILIALILYFTLNLLGI